MYTKIHRVLIAKAKEKSGNIHIRSCKCISIHKDNVILWYNDDMGSTHIVTYNITKGE